MVSWMLVGVALWDKLDSESIKTELSSGPSYLLLSVKLKGKKLHEKKTYIMGPFKMPVTALLIFKNSKFGRQDFFPVEMSRIS